MSPSRLARMLASFAGADYTASSASAMLAQSPLLSTSEQLAYGEVIQRQERDHGEVALSWAKRVGWSSQRLPSALPALGQRDCLMFAHLDDPRLRAALLLATLRAVEREAARGFRAFVQTVQAPFPEMARDFTLIMQDELEHIRVNEAATERLSGLDPAFKRMVEHAYRLTRRVYVPVIHDAIRLVG